MPVVYVTLITYAVPKPCPPFAGLVPFNYLSVSPVSRPGGHLYWIALFLFILALAIGCDTANAQNRPMGIDVSSYQGSSDSLGATNINWALVKSDGIAFAWAKATEGTGYIDPDFAYNMNNAVANGVLIGAYHFAHPDTHPGTAGADQEAAYFIATAGPYIVANGKYLVPALDAEVASPGTQAAVSAWVNEWCQDIVNYGKHPTAHRPQANRLHLPVVVRRLPEQLRHSVAVMDGQPKRSELANRRSHCHDSVGDRLDHVAVRRSHHFRH